MISPFTQTNLSNAKTYFREQLKIGQYYSSGDETIGRWYGTGAEMLGLDGDVAEEDFLKLCDNLHPKTGQRLTLQTKNARRRIFYDLTIAPPKSVSIAALIGNDKAILQAHDEAVSFAMMEFENFASTRVRGKGVSKDRLTGNIVATTFRHDTSRALDPQLHTHCLLFNATYDPEEKRWKALQNYEILRAQKFVDNVYQHVLTRGLRKLGYQITNNNRGSFEITGVGIGLIDRFSKRHKAIAKSLDQTSLAADQKKAVKSLLESMHFVSLFRGGAGVGKSFALVELQRALKDSEYSTLTLAPQRQQVIDLEKDGLENVNTVSAFLTRNEMPRGAVVLLDEGGQISAQQMLKIFRIVKENDGRIICSGDTRQHGAVEASDAMRAIEKFTGIFPVSLNTIRRQDPEQADSAAEKAFITEYRKAVKDASEGNVTFSYDRLEQAGAIVESTEEDPAALLAKNYADRIEKGQSVVAVSQTWDELQRVNEAIRETLKERDIIGSDDQSVTTFKPVDLTDAQKLDERYHPDETLIVFNRDYREFKKGDEAQFILGMDDRVVLQSKGRIAEVTRKKLGHISIFRRQEMPLAPGDRIQLKANGKTETGERLANGELVTVKTIGGRGNLTLDDGRTLTGANRQFVRGYAITSYASQGKTADQALLSDSAVRAATNRQQWYVSISRGRKGVTVYTRDRTELRRNITRLGDEPHAIDLIHPDAAEMARIQTTPHHRLKTVRERCQKNAYLHRAYEFVRRLAENLQQQQKSK